MNPTIIPIDLSGVNCYLMKQNDHFILCDTGGHLLLDKEFHNRKEELLHKLTIAGCTKDNLKLIILTHGDNDHVANAAFIRETFNAPIALHEKDLYLVQKPTLNDFLSSFHYNSFLLNIVNKIMSKGIRKITQHTLDDFTPFTPDILLNDGDSLSSYGFDAKVLHLPGHTPGSIGILTSNHELICGDIFSNSRKPSMASNALDFDLLIDSIKRLHTLDIATVYPGHGASFKFSSLAK